MQTKKIFLYSALLCGLTSSAYAAPALPAKTMHGNNETVQACKEYGAGYFFIPGTTTCFKISGSIKATLMPGADISAKAQKKAGTQNRDISWSTQGKFGLETMSSTKYGTLHTYMEFRNTWKTGSLYADQAFNQGSNTELHYSYVELGGLRFGLDETIFSHWTGYFGSVINDDLLNPNSGKRTTVLSYVYSGNNGFSAILGAEQGTYQAASSLASYEIDGDKIYKRENSFEDSSTHILPNLVGGVKYMQGWGGISFVTGYDSTYKQAAAKVRADFNLNSSLNLWAMGAVKTGRDYYKTVRSIHAIPSDREEILETTRVQRVVPSLYGDWEGFWEVLGGGAYKVLPEMQLNAQVGLDGNANFSTAFSVDYKLLPNLTITPEIAYLHYNGLNLETKDKSISVLSETGKFDAAQITVQLKYSF